MQRRINLFGMILIACVGCRSAAVTSESQSRGEPLRSVVRDGPVQVTLELNPHPARLSDELRMRLQVEVDAGVTVDRPVLSGTLGDFKIIEGREELPRAEEERVRLQQDYILEPLRVGKCRLDSITLRYVDGRPAGDGKTHSVKTDPLTVQIETVVPTEKVNLDQLTAPPGPVPVPSSSGNWLWWFLGLIPTAILVAMWRQRRRVVPLAGPGSRELALKELARVWDRQRQSPDVKRFYSELTLVVRRYIEQTTEIRAPEQTTEEFLRATAEHPVYSRDEQQRLADFLSAADLVKFAAHQPSSEGIRESYEKARRFLIATAARE